MNLNPFPSLRKATFSLLSDGELSVKRFIALILTLVLVYMIKYVTHNIVPTNNQAIFKHCFDVIAVLISLLTGAATVKDIIALKNGTKATQTETVEEPKKTTTTETVIEIPPVKDSPEIEK